MLRFAYEIEDQFGFAIEYLDIGGGLPSQNRLKAAYLPPDVAVPAHRRVRRADQRRPLPPPAAAGKFPKLIMECGPGLGR